MGLEDVTKEVDLLQEIERDTHQQAKRIGCNIYMLPECPLCNHKFHFVVYTKTNRFKSFGCGYSGSIVDWKMLYLKLDKSQVIKMLCGSIKDLDLSTIKKEREKIKAQLEKEKQYINSQFDLLCKLYKMFKNAVQTYKKNNQDFRHPDYQWLLFNFDFFDRKTNKIINADSEGQKLLLSTIIDDYTLEYKNFLNFINSLLS